MIHLRLLYLFLLCAMFLPSVLATTISGPSILARVAAPETAIFQATTTKRQQPSILARTLENGCPDSHLQGWHPWKRSDGPNTDRSGEHEAVAG